MGTWEQRYDRDGNPVLVSTADGYETRLRVTDGKLEMRFDDGLELRDECTLADVARLLACTRVGRLTMALALNGAGYSVHASDEDSSHG